GNPTFYATDLVLNIRDSAFGLLGSVTVPQSSIPLDQGIGAAEFIDVSVSSLGIKVHSNQLIYIGMVPTAVVPSDYAGNGLEWAATISQYPGGGPYVSFEGG